MVSHLSSLGYRLGVAGALLGIVAGVIQWSLGSEIPEWTGDKLHPVQLGIITIALSGLSLGCLRYLAGHREQRRTRAWALAALLVLATAIICFTTVGRLWYLPGPLLLAPLVLLLRGGER